MQKNTYPEGTKFGDYFLAKEASWYAIKRMVVLPEGSRSAVRLHKTKYKHIQTKTGSPPKVGAVMVSVSYNMLLL